MEVNCRGCAGCCLDWRPLVEDDSARDAGGRETARAGSVEGEREGTSPRRTPIDDGYNFVALTRDEIRGYLEAGMAAALTPRFWEVDDEREGVEVDGRRVAAVAGRPAFFVGLRKPPKPVAPFDREGTAWLPTCVFLDPTTLQCRIHEGEQFPDECGAYPAHNLALESETECERVEARFGGERLLDGEPGETEGLLLGPQALGAKLFCHPRPDDLEGVVDRLAESELTPADRAECLAVAAASSPGTFATSEHHYEREYERALETLEDGDSAVGAGSGENDSWVGPAIAEWHRRRAEAGETVPSPTVAEEVEERLGAPETPGWDDRS
jgi:hypothetical protein